MLVAMLVNTTIALATAIFAAFSWSLRFHFASERMPPGMLALSAASLTVFGWTIYVLSTSPIGSAGLLLALVLYGISGLLFGWSVVSSRSARLRVAFDTIEQSAVVSAGPYRFIRHPFYTSYIIFWLACALASASIVVALACPLFVTTYVLLARREERGLLASHLGANYFDY
jgi:protein-S-isoprenylcysteine O-methyltransferase Ste14